MTRTRQLTDCFPGSISSPVTGQPDAIKWTMFRLTEAAEGLLVR